MKKIPYIEAGIQKALDKLKAGEAVVLNPHSSNFHADDICATATLRLFFKYLDKKIKTKIVRSIDPKVHESATFVYDVGKIYDPKKLRFDHHQTGGAGVRPNGVQYAAFGLVWKHFGVSLCALYTQERTGKLPTRKVATQQAWIIEKRFVSHIDGMDNGQMTYKDMFEDTVPTTIDNYFEMCKVAHTSRSTDTKVINKAFDTGFMKLVPFTEMLLENMLAYALVKDVDESLALKMYAKAKDKRIVICDRFYGYNYGKLPEPLVVVYPDARSGWAAKNVRKDENNYEARFYFPKPWAGKVDDELVKETGVSGARFCHNACFLISADTKEAVLAMVQKAFEMQGIK